MHAPHKGTAAPVLIVTGASSGIGRALALAAARKDYAVVICARRGDRLDEVAAAIRAEGGTCSTVVADVRSLTTPQLLLDAARALGGRVDAVANVAGMGAPGTLLEQSDAAIAAQWDVHVAAPLRIARAALPALIATRGQLIFVGSGLARVPAPGFGAYAPAKAAIRAAAAQLRRELRDDGVGVTYVDPGAVDTEFSVAAGMQRNANAAMLAGAEDVARRILRGITRRSARVNGVPWQTAGVILGEWFPGLADAAMSRIVDSPVLRDAPTGAPQHDTIVPEHDTIVPERATIAPQHATIVPEHDTAGSGSEQCHPEERAERASRRSEGLPDLTTALEPVAHRMERVKLSRDFVASLLIPGDELNLTDVAMRWAGMPNKNERAAVGEVLAALTDAGFTESLADERWRVVRAAT